jgi:hypothetical protein
MICSSENSQELFDEKYYVKYKKYLYIRQNDRIKSYIFGVKVKGIINEGNE